MKWWRRSLPRAMSPRRWFPWPWLLRRSPVALPIPGTSSVKHLEENVSAASFQLTGSEFAELGSVVPKPMTLR